MRHPASSLDGLAVPTCREPGKLTAARSPDTRLLIIHQNFPGQFRELARAWATQPGLQVLGLGRETAPGLPGVAWQRYRLHRAPAKAQHPYLRQMEGAVLHGQAVARTLGRLARQGYKPDVVLAHPGWGETLYLRDVFPDARLIHLCEWYYGKPGADVGFDPEFPVGPDIHARMRTWNALHALNLAQCDLGISPTAWQRAQHPAEFQHKITVQHEGIDTRYFAPDPQARFRTPSGVELAAGDPVITFVARNLEPYRGFHIFMRALARIQRLHPHCHAIIVGGDEVSYGPSPDDAPNWREKLLREVSLDPARTHFTGRLARADYRRVLQVSAAHIYLTYPFVLSWSALEALSAGCLVIGSRTAPVEEVISDGENGVLVEFTDVEGISQCALQAFEGESTKKAIRAQARVSATRFDVSYAARGFRGGWESQRQGRK
ncbi:glycosyltransferase family 4 protein [Pseudothauera lacus]|uniref:Glycosyl transferase family 1 n=1 Tax=Pseudothauera lacus TaxID=2136175 RepID=A0A2T4IFA5_9RHOO|nr:glycosyltransferase family 4 protein [Pseudothauera lacus]PTD96447.1 glycosyl transferase family 1 [Pseudothauera lacus]